MLHFLILAYSAILIMFMGVLLMVEYRSILHLYIGFEFIYTGLMLLASLTEGSGLLVLIIISIAVIDAAIFFILFSIYKNMR